jgi:hypothetical protein
MRFELNALYVAKAPDMDAALALLEEPGVVELLAEVREDPLSIPWDISPESWNWHLGVAAAAPWSDDHRIVSASDVVSDALALGSAFADALLLIEAGARDAYVESVRSAAQRWISNIAELASGHSEAYERRYANRIEVRPTGSIIFCPEDFETPEPTDANMYGEVLLAARDIYPELANAMGIHPLERCVLHVTAPVTL